MSTTGGSEQGTVYVLDEPKAIEKKFKSAVTDSGSEVRRGPEKAGIGNLIEILAAVRGTSPEQIESDFSEARYGEFKTAVAEAVIEYLTPVRERYEALRADEAALEAVLAGRRGAGARDRRRHAEGRPRADGRRRARRRLGGARGIGHDRYGAAVSLAALEIDLDVFSGPFDLLLTLVLKEEVDLLELALADVVLAYLDHLEERGELDLEAATEFIVLIAALLELKSRLMLSGEEEELLDIEPEQAAEELLARMLDARQIPRGGRPPARAARRRGRRALQGRAAARRRCGGGSCRPRTARNAPRCSASRSAGC